MLLKTIKQQDFLHDRHFQTFLIQLLILEEYI